jgi:hypothetical protein
LQPASAVNPLNSEIGQGLLTLTKGSSPIGRSHDGRHEEVHVLSIELGSLSDVARDAMKIGRDEQLSWLTSAAERGSSLLLLRTDSTVEFYTTYQDRFVALRPVIQDLAARVHRVPELGKTHTAEQSGAVAAQRLLTYAARPGRPASNIHGAAALSAASAALGPTLASLFRAAANVGRRVRQETALDDSNIGPALRELETLAAARIVEEELATWQAQEAEIERATSYLPSVGEPRTQFESLEPVSEVRLRVGTSIAPRISYRLEPKRVIS